MEDTAYDCRGRLISTYSAIFIDDADKRGSFWRCVEKLKDESPDKFSIVIEKFFEDVGSVEFEKPKLIISRFPKLCSCSMTLLMRSGCKCEGV